MMNRFIAVGAAAVLAAGCADRGITDASRQGSDSPKADLGVAVGDSGLTVMTWNLYYGADLMPVLIAYLQDPTVLPTRAVEAVWNQAQATNFPERAGALARAIAASRPHLVGVQEAALWSTGASPATEDIEFDFLSILRDSLQANGLDYVVAAADLTTDIALPAGDPQDPTTWLWVRLKDRDAILARADVQIEEAASARYSSYFPIPIPGLPPDAGIYEGWSSVVATVGGRSYRFVSTHLEIKELALEQPADIQVAQAHELLGLLTDETRPTIAVGDFNSYLSSPDLFDRTSYQLITGTGEGEGGFVDSWLWPSRLAPGLTCCQNDDVNNLVSTFNKRVDYIFTRNMSQTLPAGQLVMGRGVVGDELSDITVSGLWPSDHGGVVATFRVPPATPQAAVASK